MSFTRDQVENTLLVTFTAASQQHRDQAEEQLQQFQLVPGFARALFTLVNDDATNNGIRQAAAIYFKNLTRRHWATDPRMFDAETKFFVKESILNTMCKIPTLIRKTVGLSLFHIVDNDFPQEWPNLIDSIMALISTQDIQIVYGALHALRIVVKRYEWVGSRSPEKRDILYKIVQTTFPRLLDLYKALLKENSLEAMQMIVIIIKIFKSCTSNLWPDPLNDRDVIYSWITILVTTLERPISIAGEPELLNERLMWGPWLAKKTISSLFEHFFGRYGKLRKEENDGSKLFVQIFHSELIPKLLESISNILVQFGKTAPGNTFSGLINFLNHATFYPESWAILKPNIPAYFEHILFPIICFKQEDEENFETDPQEFLRAQFDIISEFRDIRIACIDLIINTIDSKTGENLMFYVNALNELLTSFQTAPNPYAKEGALRILGKLSRLIRKNEMLSSQMESVLINFVIPELTSPINYLRTRAIWTFSRYAKINFVQYPQMYCNSVEVVLNSLSDQSLPVRVHSALALKGIVNSDIAKPLIEPYIGVVIESFLSLMNDIDIDRVITSIETIIDVYENKMHDHAYTLTQGLIQRYNSLIQGDDDDNKAMVALYCLKAIQTLLFCLTDHPELYIMLEPVLTPTLLNINTEIIDFFDEYISILTFLTYYPANLPPRIWEIFDLYCEAFMLWAFDFLPELLVPFDNIISKASEQFVRGGHIIKIMEIYQHVLVNDPTETSAAEAAKLIEVVLLNCTGIDNMIDPIIANALPRVQGEISDNLKILLINIVVNCFYYNPIPTFATLENRGWTDLFFNYWFGIMGAYTRKHDIKLSILALCSILFKIPSSQIPNAIRSEMVSLTQKTIELIFKFQDVDKIVAEQVAKRKKMEEEFDRKFEAKVHGDEDDLEEYNALASNAAEFYEDLEEDFNFEKFDLEKDNEFSSKIDEVDEVLFFLEAFTSYENLEPQTYQQIVSALPPAIVQSFETIKVEGQNRMLPKQ
eukprot:TRINITY_DN5409_c0_g1_i1.p1 TRINITY_DN5409_c0_g1~~TRINITY_DN5409_c0_g1_i1.p1  ORF type:complete len:991 (+),score=205.24 TRINITY_DN5409_c0_g1_i1:46-3018(+)